MKKLLKDKTIETRWDFFTDETFDKLDEIHCKQG